MKPLHILLGLIGVAALVVLLNSVFIVSETERALVLTLGKVDTEITQPGLKFKKPFIQQVVKYDNRILEMDSQPEEVVTQDKKRLVVDSFLRWRIADAKTFYETQRTLLSARSQLAVIVSSATKRTLAREDAHSIISGERGKIMDSILQETRSEAKRLGIEVVDVRIKRADLPAENSHAVYNRMRAERNKEAKEIRATGEEEAQKIRSNAERQRTVLLAEAERKAEGLRGEGDAEAIKVFADAFGKDPDFYNLTRTLQAYRKGLAKPDTLLVLDPSVDFMKTLTQGAKQ